MIGYPADSLIDDLLASDGGFWDIAETIRRCVRTHGKFCRNAGYTGAYVSDHSDFYRVGSID